MSSDVFTFKLAEKISDLLGEYGIRVPEDVEAEMGELLFEELSEELELAWQFRELCD